MGILLNGTVSKKEHTPKKRHVCGFARKQGVAAGRTLPCIVKIIPGKQYL
jgi:hypothetical protein